MSENNNHGMAMDEIEPDYDSTPPQTLTRSRHIDNVFWLAGRAPIEGQEHYDVMFVAVAPEEEEVARNRKTTFGFNIQVPPEYLKGGNGVIKDIALRAGIDIDKCYYTSLVKWLLPRTKRARPPVKIMKYGLPVLMDEIKRIKPRIIVCLGKQVFDMLSDKKIGFDDSHGGWFWSSSAEAHLYVMYPPFALVTRPELYETFRIDFVEIARKIQLMTNVDIKEIPARWEVIRDEASLRRWVERIKAAEATAWPGHRDQYGNRLIAVDCEWHGRQHIDGQLRTIQFAWSESDAVVIEFRNEKNEWSFQLDPERQRADRERNAVRMRAAADKATAEGDMFAEDDAEFMIAVDRVLAAEGSGPKMEALWYREIGDIIAEALNVPDIKYIGHHYSADSLWMEHWLGLDVYQKCALDTEFAQQCVDESSELGLERGIAMKYTTLGFYNQDLIEWKRANRSLCEEGYGYIPSKILIPYSVFDVLAPYRAYPRIRKQMEGQQLTEYYDRVLNPFVTDVFHCFAAVGLPMDRPQMDDMRVLFHFARRHLEVNLKRRIHEEAKATVLDKLIDEVDYAEGFRLWMETIKASDPSAAIEVLKPHVKMENIGIWIKRLQHMFDAQDFNIRSPDMMRRWLFDVEGLVPIKSTNQKAKGMPSMAWDKVLELPADRQRLYTPAVDKQTLQILSEQLETLDELLNLNAVGNVCKAFLKEADVVKVGGPSKNLVAPTVAEPVGDFTEAYIEAEGEAPYDGVNWIDEAGALWYYRKAADKWRKAGPRFSEEYYDTHGSTPTDGDTWRDKGDGKLYVYDNVPGVWMLVPEPATAETPINPGELLFLEGDEDSGSSDPLEIVKENGLHAWLIETPGPMKDRVSCMTSTTETGRSRSWRPNTLNWPSYVNKRIGKSVVKAVREAHETGDLPETLMKWLTVGEDSLPSIRSCVKAPEGWLLVESDYKTAEMVGLAVISGDPKFIKILREPDPEWAVLKKGGLGPYVRVRYAPSEESGIPPEAQDPQYIMSVWKDGKKVGDVTEDDLERNADGTVKHRGYDIHWSIAERIYEKPREAMVEKVARSAGKVINFCLATGQPILTDRGWIPIEQLSDCDLLWDGVEWVSHAGLHDSGIREVSYHDGLWATPGHNVWTEGGKVRFEEACAQQVGLVHIGGAREGTDSGWPDHLPGDRSREGVGLLLPDDGVSVLRQTSGEGVAEHGEGTVVKVPLPESGGAFGLRSARSPDADAGVALQRNDAAMLQDDPRIQSGLQGSWHQGIVRKQEGLHHVGGDKVAGGDLQGEGLRSQGQQRGLLEGESAPSDALREFVEQAQVGLAGYRDGQGIPGQAPARDLHRKDSRRDAEAELLGRGDTAEVVVERESRMAQTYDVLNVGPRRRFFCAGALVSNSSAYGASPASLERKIESDTGVKPEEGTGQKGLDAIAARQPRATEFLEEMAALPKTTGFYRAASGRIRHAVLHGRNSDVGWRVRNSQESAAGREFKNVAMQESVGATSARACTWALALYKALGLQARPLTCLYDSLVSICPLEERFVVSRLHDVVMSEINSWEYDDAFGKRTLRYEVDNEFNYRWSTRPTKAEQAQLADESWHPTPERLQWALTFENWADMVS